MSLSWAWDIWHPKKQCGRNSLLGTETHLWDCKDIVKNVYTLFFPMWGHGARPDGALGEWAAAKAASSVMNTHMPCLMEVYVYYFKPTFSSAKPPLSWTITPFQCRKMHRYVCMCSPITTKHTFPPSPRVPLPSAMCVCVCRLCVHVCACTIYVVPIYINHYMVHINY